MSYIFSYQTGILGESTRVSSSVYRKVCKVTVLIILVSNRYVGDPYKGYPPKQFEKTTPRPISAQVHNTGVTAQYLIPSRST